MSKLYTNFFSMAIGYFLFAQLTFVSGLHVRIRMRFIPIFFDQITFSPLQMRHL